jgi:hypothetical protein
MALAYFAFFSAVVLISLVLDGQRLIILEENPEAFIEGERREHNFTILTNIISFITIALMYSLIPIILFFPLFPIPFFFISNDFSMG